MPALADYTDSLIRLFPYRVRCANYIDIGNHHSWKVRDFNEARLRAEHAMRQSLEGVVFVYDLRKSNTVAVAYMTEPGMFTAVADPEFQAAP